MTEETLISDQELTSIAHRVKIYQLNMDTVWEDKGTGFCSYQLGSEGKPDQIIVRSENDDKIILASNVFKRRLYQRQQDTLIVWTEDDNRDLALSFQDYHSCEEIWQNINKKQEDNNGGLSPTDSPENTTLPEPEMSNLKEILKVLSSAYSLFEKDKIATFISIENYIQKLLNLFETCEDLEDIADLHLLYDIILKILMLTDHGIIEQLVTDEHVFNFMGILEYNPNTPDLKAKHREFLRTKGNIKQIVEFNDKSIKRKINQTFRLEYLQTILLQNTKEIDDSLISLLNNIIFQNHVEIVNHIQNNHTLLNELFQYEEDKRDDVIQFIHQLCQLAKQMQASIRLHLFRSLSTYGLLDIMCYSLVHSDKTIRTTAVNLLQSFTELDVSTVRSHLLTQTMQKRDKPLLIQIIVEQCAADANHELKIQYFEILRHLLDSNNNNNNHSNSPPINDLHGKKSSEIDEFLDLFYEKYMDAFLKPIKDLEIKDMYLKGPVEPLELTSDQAQLCLYICEFINFMVRNHGYRSKYVMLNSDTVKKVLQLYRSKYTYIKLCALRFIRICISISDEFYIQCLLKNKVFEPTIRIFLDTNGRDCLLNSACLELLEYIRKENIKVLVDHLITKFGSVLDTITYISTCKQLRLKYEHNLKAQEELNNENDDLSSKSDKNINHDGWSSSTVDDGEEEYFNTSDEEKEETDSLTPQTSKETHLPITPLVNYDDDDDDDDDDDEAIIEDKEESRSLKRKAVDDNEEEEKEESNSTKSLPPPFKSRKVLEEDEDDLLTKRKPLTLAKKIVIKTANIKRTRS
ncbi:component of IIS longevity pathway SMK-1-domain-containing protein [Cokeromyces recurvatus]|uniref:component of IIS longevity pathway SMK-1-domain-containing protein n=1 Tax=Cokeromyces recurvatus TaxID=90255 RepID=UPI0022200E56|nr:component of IIS longevity pathway SMK-1-domain-containing protein [Cokeromyces recurvatus]KAI7900067.1 component of IIS longevity pathway SMK-1-domain-containing protein [Cokeromyces recurvatus]